MQFRTELTPDVFLRPIGLDDRLVTLGSCFAEVMGQRLTDHKLTVLNNPFGTVFNAVSMGKLVAMALKCTPGNVPGTLLDENGYVQRDGLWFHYDFHSSCWGHTRADLQTRLSQRLLLAGEALRRANWLLLTLGSAVVYRHNDRVVANCHKMPGTLFQKSLCPAAETSQALTDLITTLQAHNPDLQIVLTVSPVRHLRDGLMLNAASKAQLRWLCHELSGMYPQVQYFPAYELVQDDLRDYRFYEADLTHPTAQAHNYVFTKFAQSAFSPDLQAFAKQWAQLWRDMAHRPQHGLTDAHRLFLQNLLNRLNALPVTVDTTAERADIDRQLHANPGA